MDARFYNSEEIDIERLGQDLVNIYLAQHYQAQNVGNKDQMLVQLKKGGDFEAILGMQAALTVTIQRTAGGVLAMIGQQKWIDKAAVGAVGIAVLPLLWPLALTAGVGALRQASLGNQVLNMVDSLVRQQRPNVIAGPVPVQLLPQAQQQWAPPNTPAPYYTPPASYNPPPPQPIVPAPPAPRPVAAPTPPASPAAQAPTKLRCQYCNTPYEPGDTFCTGCGRSLTPSKVYCPNCHAELKANSSFCANCGASTFQAVTAANQPVQPKPAPVVPPTVVTYTQAQTPSAAPAQPAQPAPQVPYYSPKPQPPAQKTPSAPAYTPPAAAQPAPPPPPKPAVPEYIPPPQMQEPPVKPQPKVTFIPGSNKQEAAGLTPPPPTPQQTYYVPSSSASSSAPTIQQQSSNASSSIADQQTLTNTQASSSSAAADQPTVEDTPYYTPPASSISAASQPTVAGTGPKPLMPKPTSQPSYDASKPWGTLSFSDGKQVELSGERTVVGRYDHDLGGITPEVDLSGVQGSDTASRVHAAIEHIGSSYTLTDLNSTNATRLNGKRLEPDKPAAINDGDTLQFGKITCTFKRL